MAKHVNSQSEFDSQLSSAGGKLVVVDFHAQWCGPCKVIAPVYENLAKQFTNVVFLKVDVDAVQPVAQKYSIRAMPTFLFIKNKSVVDTLQGANASKLQQLLRQHSSGGSSAFSGSGQTLAGGSGPRNTGPGLVQGITEGHSSLLPLIDSSQSFALNESSTHGLKSIIKGPSGGSWLESDADEQLLICLSFNQKVRISGLYLRTNPSHFPSAPKSVKIFANRQNLSFEDAESEEATQSLELAEEDVKGGPNGGGGRAIALKLVKFQNLNSITIAILSNQGGEDITIIDAIDAYGLPSETTNMNDLKKIEGEAEPKSLGGKGPSRTGLKGGSSSRGSTVSPSSSFSNRPLQPNQRYGAANTTSVPAAQGDSGAAQGKPRYRRKSSVSTSASGESFVDEEGEERQHIPHSPPHLSLDEEQLFEAGHQTGQGEGAFGGWHYAPLFVALVPPLGAIIGGRADAWTDAILLILASFWLYQFIRVPWELYYTARTRRILSYDADASEVEAELAGEDEDGTSRKSDGTESEERLRAKEAASVELRRTELLSLLFCVLSPFIGAWLLNWLKESLTDGGRYLNTFNIRLFTLAAGIKPWTHAISLIRRRMIHLQEEVHYPNAKVELLNRRLRRLESDLSSLRKLYATKNDIRALRDVDAQLGRAVRRSERKEEHLRLSAEDKFNLVESRLEDLLREVAINAELIEEERRERERAASLRISLFEAIKFMLGAGIGIRSGTGQRHYLHDAPRSLPSTASLGIGMGGTSPTEVTAQSPYHHYGSRNASGPVSSLQQIKPGGYHAAALGSSGSSGGSPPDPASSPTSIEAQMISQYYSGVGGQGTSHGRSRSPPNSTAGSNLSPPNDYQGSSGQQAILSQTHSQPHSPWWESGLAFYLFLPLNMSNAAMRFAGEKVRSVIEDKDPQIVYRKHQLALSSSPKIGSVTGNEAAAARSDKENLRDRDAALREYGRQHGQQRIKKRI
ncbi:thioredoxin-domain-containing protein [Violaceomyces palustris]|uniref:Thioredoxin-domain-containing protein n=1 Tax=Violaceomyces palustris TaxID=1673888 RepID=A0ACD0NSV8_9BASI|nr:thioredoxin-domain-containing protein [Violaceomyces palustris]